MSTSGLNIRPDGALDFLSIGALVHRLDTGVVPFRKATECQIHVSGGEYNCAANVLFGDMTSVGRCSRSTSHAVVAVLPVPVAPISTTSFVPDSMRRAISAIALG